MTFSPPTDPLYYIHPCSQQRQFETRAIWNMCNLHLATQPMCNMCNMHICMLHICARISSRTLKTVSNFKGIHSLGFRDLKDKSLTDVCNLWDAIFLTPANDQIWFNKLRLFPQFCNVAMLQSCKVTKLQSCKVAMVWKKSQLVKPNLIIGCCQENCISSIA